MQPKECYTLTQRDLKYTLIRLAVRVYAQVVVGLMEELKIIPQELPGFDSVTGISGSNGSMEEHPGFQLMVKHMNENSVMLDVWMEKGDLQTNKEGLLWCFRTSSDYSKMKKRKLVTMTQELVEENKRLAAKQSSLEERNDLLALENAEHVQKVEELEEKIEKLKEKNSDLRCKVSALKAVAWAEEAHRELHE